MRGSARRWSGWILVGGFAVGLAGMVLGTEAGSASCCPEPCQWILASECCDLSPAVQAPPSLQAPPIVTTHVVQISPPPPIDIGVDSVRRAPRVPLGIRTTVLRL